MVARNSRASVVVSFKQGKSRYVQSVVMPVWSERQKNNIELLLHRTNHQNFIYISDLPPPDRRFTERKTKCDLFF